MLLYFNYRPLSKLCILFLFSLGFMSFLLTFEDSWANCKNPVGSLRIIALNSDCLEVLRILNAQEMVVGINDTIAKEKTFWGNLADLPVVGS